MKVSNRTLVVWRVHLGSAFRTTLACAIVGVTTLYGPTILRREIAFASFAYATAVLIVTDATLGHGLRGCWGAICATCQVIPSSILILWLVGPANFSPWVAAGLVTVGAFLVALPQFTNLLCKQIAFGHMVIVCVSSVIHKEQTNVVMHPVRIALSTGLGVVAAVLALSLPYPRLAYLEIQKLCQSYAENASERINLFMEAFSARETSTTLDAIYQSKPFAETGEKLLRTIKTTQDGVIWERPHIRDLKSYLIESKNRLEAVELAMRGMEIALSSIPFYPDNNFDEKLRKLLVQVQAQMGLTLNQRAKRFLPSNETRTSSKTDELSPFEKFVTSYRRINPNGENLAAFFFLLCVKLFEQGTKLDQNHKSGKEESTNSSFKKIFKIFRLMPTNKTLIFALKCSISLGLAVFFGLIYNTKRGYWAGLTIAITFTTRREATFTRANSRTQGTALGSIYGILGCFLFENIPMTKIVALVPWIVFTSFLMKSRLYGQAGGISVIIAALLILGRDNYGNPVEFAINRLTEAFIGLLCSIAVEILLQPTRAATLAKIQLSESVGMIKRCVNEVTLTPDRKDMPLIMQKIGEIQEKMKLKVDELRKMIGDADLEPNFWFTPFRTDCYKKLLHPITKMRDLVFFMQYNMELLVEASEKCKLDWNVLHERINGDLLAFKKNIGSKLDYLEKVSLIKSIKTTEIYKQPKETQDDFDMENIPNVNECKIQIEEEFDPKKIVNLLRKCSEEVVEKIHEESIASEMTMYLNALGFCFSSFAREMVEVEKGIYDLIRWENPTSRINFENIFG